MIDKTTSKIIDLALTADNGNVTIKEMEQVLNKVINMVNKQYLSGHPYEIYFSKSDNRYRTYLPPEKEGGKRIPITARKKEDLEEKLINYYKGKDEKKGKKPNNLEEIYPLFKTYKFNASSGNNARKLDWVWKTYYKDSEIVKIPFEDLTVMKLKNWYIDAITKNSLTRKRFDEVKSLANMMFDYAVEDEICATNKSRAVRNLSSKLFTPERVKSYGEQVYTVEEQKEFIDAAINWYKKSQNTSYLLIALNFLLGLRIGEAVALKKSDFSETKVHIQRQEIKNTEYEDGKLLQKGFKVVEYTKTPQGNREIELVDYARQIYNAIIAHNEKNGFTSEYILLDKKGHRKHAEGVEKLINKINSEIGTIPKANHCIRKTYISTVANAKCVADKELQRQAGHKDYTTTQSCYIFPISKPEELEQNYRKAVLEGRDKVFESVQRLNVI